MGRQMRIYKPANGTSNKRELVLEIQAKAKAKADHECNVDALVILFDILRGMDWPKKDN